MLRGECNRKYLSLTVSESINLRYLFTINRETDMGLLRRPYLDSGYKHKGPKELKGVDSWEILRRNTFSLVSLSHRKPISVPGK